MSLHREVPTRSHNPDEAMTALAEKMGTVPSPKPERLYRCPDCLDSGWVWLEDDSHVGTVARCSRGCEVPAKKNPAAREPSPPAEQGAVTIT